MLQSRAVQATVLIEVATRTAAGALRVLHGEILRQATVGEILVAGPGGHAVAGAPKTQVLGGPPGRGLAVRAGLARAAFPAFLVQDADPLYDPAEYARLLAPLDAGEADAVYGVRWQTNGARGVTSFAGHVADRALTLFTGAVANLALADGETGLKAFRTDVLRRVTLTADDAGIDAEIAVKLAAQAYRIAEVPVHVRAGPLRRRSSEQLARALTLLRYATIANDTDNRHEGYNTLLRMEDGAPNYNRWLAKTLSPHLGQRVLEVGAGIGTMTRLFAPGRDLVIALEVDAYYVERLTNLFRHWPNVKPVLADAQKVDWDALTPLRPDTAVLSNVLEHIEDDIGVARSICRILPAGGRLVVLVPALPALYGSLDRAVGHYRRYTRQGIERVLREAGFAEVATRWLNLTGIAGWFVNGRIFRRRAMPPIQLRLYDKVSPLLTSVEDRFRLPLGMSLLAVGRRA